MIDTGATVFAGLCLDTPLCDVPLSFKRHCCCLRGRQKKSILTAGPKIIFLIICWRQRQIVQPFFFFFTMWHIFGILLNYSKQQTHFLALLRGYQGRGLNITFQTTVASSCRSNSQNCATAMSNFATTDDRRLTTAAATPQNTSSRARIHPPHFWGPQRAPQTALRLCACLANNGQAGLQVACRGLEMVRWVTRLTSGVCSLRRGQLELRCRPHISVLVFFA
jgi:hypothetical protein